MRRISKIIIYTVCVLLALSVCVSACGDSDPVLSLDKKKVTLEQGKSVKLTPLVDHGDAKKLKFTWTTSDPAVATVKNGSVKAVGAGTAEITCKTTLKNGIVLKAKAAVTVNVPVKNIKFSLKKEKKLFVGETYTIEYQIQPEDASDKSLKWSSSDPSIATVDANGTVKAVAAGKATITAKTKDGSGKKAEAEFYIPLITNRTNSVTVNETSGTSFSFDYYGSRWSSDVTIKQKGDCFAYSVKRTGEPVKVTVTVKPIKMGSGSITFQSKQDKRSSFTVEVIVASDLLTEAAGGVKNRYYSALKRYDYILDSAPVGSDHTIVGDKFLSFISGDDKLTKNGQIKIVTYGNGFDKPKTDMTMMYHRLGHCNTVDYNEENDCLILGNGSGSYTLAGKIFIIPQFREIIESGKYSKPDSPLTLENSNAIVIDCSSHQLGAKFNVIWGERNLTKNNIAYLITAKYGAKTPQTDGGDNGTIRRILLGTGTNQLPYGSYTAAGDDEFNGTFEIVDVYTQPGTTYDNANQGCCYFNGRIYACIGHDGLWLWVMNLDRHNNRIWYDEYKQRAFNDDGTAIGNNQANTSGICYHDGYFYIGINQIGVVAIKEFN